MLTRVLWTALFLSLLATPATAQKRCVKGKACGNTCIAVSKTCHVGAGSATQATRPAVAVIPEGVQYVASTRGTTYYHVGCSGWKSLAVSNLRWFRDVDAARAAGLKPSAQAGCVGPTASTAPTAAGQAPAASSSSCTVARVIDGDTLDCASGVRVRLLLIDAPEMNQGPFGALAKVRLEQLAPIGTRLTLEHDVEKQDRYGRTLAHVMLPDGRNVNEELLRAGMAVVSVYPPNVNRVEQYRAASDSAEAARAGLWSVSAFDCLPADHRAGKCR